MLGGRETERGAHAGTRTVLLGDAGAEHCKPDFVARDVAEAVRWILER
jgi:hypothetical protein